MFLWTCYMWHYSPSKWILFLSTMATKELWFILLTSAISIVTFFFYSTPSDRYLSLEVQNTLLPNGAHQNSCPYYFFMYNPHPSGARVLSLALVDALPRYTSCHCPISSLPYQPALVPQFFCFSPVNEALQCNTSCWWRGQHVTLCGMAAAVCFQLN